MTAPRTWTPERRALLSNLLEAGKTCAQAAKALGAHRGAVCWAAARYGIGREPMVVASKAQAPVTGWDESRLTERWADRKRASA